MTQLDFHIIVRITEDSQLLINEVAQHLGPDGTMILLARRKEDIIFRMHADSDCYLYFKLKYGSEKVWIR